MEDNFSSRLEALIKELGYDSVNKFDKDLGVSKGHTYTIIAGRQSKPAYLYLVKVLLLFPQVDARWLLTGDGEMFTPDKVRREYVEQLEAQLTEIKEEAKIYKFSVMQAMANSQKVSFSSVSKSLPVGKVVKVNFTHSLANKAFYEFAM